MLEFLLIPLHKETSIKELYLLKESKQGALLPGIQLSRGGGVGEDGGDEGPVFDGEESSG